ncbi:hypothetical protein FHETE_7642 [Fusarium heterosporum]|uniref:Uncharacterized protein n=1 Tax=Fusarium heterosporum TaxID=42747 RepID=A0A8H5T5Q6_FUSHE|nr:hypothetical protein FHETE_7642 [Fusarium heterosporum]
MASHDKSRRAIRSGPLHFSRSTKEKTSSDLPSYEELMEDLGLGPNVDPKLMGRFSKARTNYIRDFIHDNRVEQQDLADWSEESCQSLFRKMARYFLWARKGARFWPNEASAANKKGYTSHRNGQVLVIIETLLAKTFFVYHNTKRRNRKNKSQMAPPLTTSYMASFKTYLERNGQSIDTSIEVDNMSDYGLHIPVASFVSQSPRREPEQDDDLPAIEDMQPRVEQEVRPVFMPPPRIDRDEPIHDAPSEQPLNTTKPPVRHPQCIPKPSLTKSQTNPQAKRPAEAEPDTRRQTKSPRQNRYHDLFMGLYGPIDDDDSSTFHAQEEDLYSQLEGRAKRRTRQKDYGREGSEFGPFTSRFPTIDRAISVNRDPFCMNRRSVAAPVAPMAIETIEPSAGSERVDYGTAESVVPRRDSFVSSAHEIRSQIVYKPPPKPSSSTSDREIDTAFKPGDADMGTMEEEHAATAPQESRAALSQNDTDTSSKGSKGTTDSPNPQETVLPPTTQSPITSRRPGSGHAKTLPYNPIPKNHPSAEAFLLQMPKTKFHSETNYNPANAKRILDTHLRGHAKETATPIMFSFAVHHRTGHGDRFKFSPFDFFAMTLKTFMAALPMENKGLIAGLCIRQYGPRLCLRQVYLYNEEVFGNIREEFMRHVETDISCAKHDGKRLDYEISIEPLTEDG